ncbi:MAG: hypothetical protein K0Q67_3305, partial [Cellvibrio sp.]|nr:hypothetical protein [Cellvibrio sp.]
MLLTKRFLLALRQKYCRSASWMGARLAKAAAVRSLPGCRICISSPCAANCLHTPTGWHRSQNNRHHEIATAEPDGSVIVLVLCVFSVVRFCVVKFCVNSFCVNVSAVSVQCVMTEPSSIVELPPMNSRLLLNCSL